MISFDRYARCPKCEGMTPCAFNGVESMCRVCGHKEQPDNTTRGSE